MQGIQQTRDWTDSELDLLLGTQPWPQPVPIHRESSACSGPCDQGRRASKTPEACRLPTPDAAPTVTSTRWGFAALLISAFGVILFLAKLATNH